MTQPRSRREKGGETGVDGAARLASFGVLVGVVFGVILLGATLRTDNTRDPAPSGAHLANTALPPAQRLEPPPAAREAIPAPLSEFPGLDQLAARAQADAQRLDGATQTWTAQLGVFCDPERVQALVNGSRDDANLYILPAFHAGEACFRACWGRYETPDTARAARDLPAPLRRIVPHPMPKRIAEALE